MVQRFGQTNPSRNLAKGRSRPKKNSVIGTSRHPVRCTRFVPMRGGTRPINVEAMQQEQARYAAHEQHQQDQ